ncbi:MarR family transcriptional regulator [Terrabacter aerolatus]|uniref:MarR family transcriptional regulator n=1 Tax=Terrabacter aerolatus TaxID=422442 RepID=A0A512D121_9MICO|nr:MarR family transcriptional regulator [Terrabacter aerolatus]GEO30167.1 MarR family transcriptional regulator [Terrabacter aerolatus]
MPSRTPASLAAADPTPIEPTAARAAHDVRVTFSRLRRRLRDVAELDGLTPSQTAVLSRLLGDGDATASALASAEQVRPQSMAATLAVLEERGLVERRPDPTDGRRQLVSLTSSGHSRIDVSRAAREEWLSRALTDDFTEAERRTVVEAMVLLDRLSRR